METILTPEVVESIRQMKISQRYSAVRSELITDDEFAALPNAQQWRIIKEVAYAAGITDKITPTNINRTPEAYKEMFRKAEGRSPRRPSQTEQWARWSIYNVTGIFPTYADIDEFHLEHPSPTGKRNWRMFVEHLGCTL